MSPVSTGRPPGGCQNRYSCRSPAVEVGFEPRRTCTFTRFRVLRTAVHYRPPVFVTSADRMPAVAGERLRTGVNEPKTEPRAWRRGAAAGRPRALAHSAR